MGNVNQVVSMIDTAKMEGNATTKNVTFLVKMTNVVPEDTVALLTRGFVYLLVALITTVKVDINASKANV